MAAPSDSTASPRRILVVAAIVAALLPTVTACQRALKVGAVDVADLPEPPEGAEDDVEIVLDGDRCPSPSS
jgi:hypothetical protein